MFGAQWTAIILSIVCIACGLIANDVDFWYYVKVASAGTTEENVIHSGLWQLCFRERGETNCTKWSELDADLGGPLNLRWLHTCQYLMVIGLVSNVLAYYGAMSALRTETPTARLPQALAFLSGTCYLLAAIIYSATYSDSLTTDLQGGNLHAGFGVALVAGFVMFGPACLLDRRIRAYFSTVTRNTYARLKSTDSDSIIK